MKPSSVATRSKIRGTSCCFTVVTRTSGALGATGVLREQPAKTIALIRSAQTRVNGFMISHRISRLLVEIIRIVTMSGFVGSHQLFRSKLARKIVLSHATLCGRVLPLEWRYRGGT